jgi:hypothetical protein
MLVCVGTGDDDNKWSTTTTMAIEQQQKRLPTIIYGLVCKCKKEKKKGRSFEKNLFEGPN